MSNIELGVSSPAVSAERGASWKNEYQKIIREQVSGAITSLGLDLPWQNITGDQLKHATAQALWSCVLASFGPKLTGDDLRELNIRRFGPDYVTENVAAHVFTGNHLSISCHLASVAEAGEVIAGRMVHHMPTFAMMEGGKPTIGDLSPVSLTQKGNDIFLELSTPSGNVWKKKVEVMPAPDHVLMPVGSAGIKELLKTIASPCVSDFQVLILRPDCQENCLMCTVPRGNGRISPEYQLKIAEVMDVLIDYSAAKGGLFRQTLSGGSLASGDGGFQSAHAWGMALLAEKLALEEKKIGYKIPVQLQLEMILPANKATWQPVIDTIAYYNGVLGWQMSLAINMEVIQDSWKPQFLKGSVKSVTSVNDHLEFAALLAKATKGAVKVNSLVMFGMKPQTMTYNDYLTGDLAALADLIKGGIKPDYQPVKIENGNELETLPPPSPVYLMVQDAALKSLVQLADLKWSPGCVGGCNACDQSHESNQLVRVAKKSNVPLSILFEPILAEIGNEYQQIYQYISK